MKKLFNTTAVLGAVLLAGGTMSFAQESGESLFMTKCKMCHGATGTGDTPIGKKFGIKPFSDPEIAKKSDSDLQGITTNGSGKMPAYKDKLTEDQIKSLVAHIRTLQKK